MATYYVATTGNDTTGTGGIGDPYASPGKASGVAVSGDTIAIKSGTYTVTSGTANVAGGRVSLANGVKLEGYNTTLGDLGTPPVVHAGGVTGITLITDTGTGTFNGTMARVVNVEVDGNNGASNNGINLVDYTHPVYRCIARNCPGNGFNGSANHIGYMACRAVSCGVGFANTLGTAVGCIATSCTTGFSMIRTVLCIAHACTTGFNSSTNFPAVTVSCVAYGCASHGFSGSYDIRQMVNCIAYGNGGYGFNWGGTTSSCPLINCAQGANTSGGFNPVIGSQLMAYGTVTLTVDPFIDAPNGNFALNATSGGGAACRAAGFPGTFPSGFTTGYADIGAVQHQDSGGGVANTGLVLGEIGIPGVRAF